MYIGVFHEALTEIAAYCPSPPKPVMMTWDDLRKRRGSCISLLPAHIIHKDKEKRRKMTACVVSHGRTGQSELCNIRLHIPSERKEEKFERRAEHI